jgi:hypothetical protein
MVKQLLDFDRSKVRRAEVVISWKAIAFELGVSEDTLQRWCVAQRISLPHWGPARRSPVFLPRQKIVILKNLYFA